jgi:hypothetical protein
MMLFKYNQAAINHLAKIDKMIVEKLNLKIFPVPLIEKEE